MKYKEEINIRGLKIKWVADKIGVSPTRLSMCLSGKRKLPILSENKLIKLIEKTKF